MKYTLAEILLTYTKSNFHFLEDIKLKEILMVLEGAFVGGGVINALLDGGSPYMEIVSPLSTHQALEKLTHLKYKPKCQKGHIFYLKIKKQHREGHGVPHKKLRIDIHEDFLHYRLRIICDKNWNPHLSREENLKSYSLQREFSENAIFLAPENNNYVIYDYHEGLKDLKNGEINFLGDYRRIIGQDYLILMRLITFAVSFPQAFETPNGMFKLEKFKEFVIGMKNIPLKSFMLELKNLLKCAEWYKGIKILNSLGISKLFFSQDLWDDEKDRVRFFSQNIGLWVVLFKVDGTKDTFDKNYFIFSRLSFITIWQLPTINFFSRLYMMGRKLWCQFINPFLELIANTFLNIGLKMWEQKTLAFIAMLITTTILVLLVHIIQNFLPILPFLVFLFMKKSKFILGTKFFYLLPGVFFFIIFRIIFRKILVIFQVADKPIADKMGA